jgi:putative Holliday junction resolvase
VIGLAICDPTGLIARPLDLLYRTSKKEDFSKINAIILKHDVKGVIVGLPVSPPHITAYTQADRVRLWASRLAAAISVPIYLWNERYSSDDAAEILAAAGKPIPERIDSVAAAVILQSFLDTLRDEGIAWPEPVPPADPQGPPA